MFDSIVGGQAMRQGKAAEAAGLARGLPTQPLELVVGGRSNSALGGSAAARRRECLA